MSGKTFARARKDATAERGAISRLLRTRLRGEDTQEIEKMRDSDSDREGGRERVKGPLEEQRRLVTQSVKFERERERERVREFARGVLRKTRSFFFLSWFPRRLTRSY